MTLRRTTLWALLVASVASGCTVAIEAGRPAEIPSDAFVVSAEADEQCTHGLIGQESASRETLPGPVTDSELLPYVARLDARVRRTALAAGLEPLIARLLREEERSSEPSIQTLAMRQELAERVSAMDTRLTAMEFEVDCERGLLRDALDEYTESETDRQLDLTIASLVVGAASGVAAGVWDLANSRTSSPFFTDGPLLTSIVGAAITTALGIAVISPKERALIYPHRRNVLEPVLLGEDPQVVFPPVIFRLLTLPAVDGAATPRQQLITRWQRLTSDEIEPDDQALADSILYGEGGVYDPDLLQVHAALLEVLGATLDGLAADVDLLSRALEITLEGDLYRANHRTDVEGTPQ